jgi:hypothetical protein
MARGRDLTFSLLSDVSKFSTDEPARDLDTLGTAARDAGADLDDLDDARKRLNLDDLGDEAARSAKEIDRAFDKIAASSKKSARDVDDDTDKVKRSLRSVGDEADSTGREMAASFSGSGDDIRDGFQELAANALADLGPVGAAAGAAAALGIGLITAEQEKLKTLTNELVEVMLEEGGKLSDAAVDARITTMIAEDAAKYVELGEKLERLGVPVRDYMRALAGDPEAAKTTLDVIADLSTAITDQAAASGTASGEMYAQQTALNELAGEIGTTAQAYEIATSAIALSAGAQSAAVQKEGENTRAEWERTREALAKPVVARTKLETENLQREALLARLELQAFYNRHPVTIPVKQGKRPIRDVP